MWEYEKRLQYPVKIKNPDARAAKVIITQYGGPDGELGASLRYLSQRFSMPDPRVAGLLTDIGIEDFNCAFYKSKIRGETLMAPLFCKQNKCQ